jgi:hypothetical protein
MVPGPESNNNLEAPTDIKTEHELRFSDGTQVPEPRMVTVIPDLFPVMSYPPVLIEIITFVNCKT